MNDEEEFPKIAPYSETKGLTGNPQQRAFEAVPRYRPKMVFVSGKGMVPDPSDISSELQYDVNEAALDSEADMKQRPASTNMGYSALKKRR